MDQTTRAERGFTLIELSIVLVIIGLIVGGVLVGQDLIRAAAVRAQISQIEKYNTAVNTFREKYSALPGDIAVQAANSFGFVAPGPYVGTGDGNGLIEGNAGGNTVCDGCQQGETAMFWVDLSIARLIDGTFNTATNGGLSFAPVTDGTSPALRDFFPAAKIGGGNYVYVYAQNGVNYFAVSVVTSLGSAASVYSVPGFAVAQARSIDSKIDDGLPQTGSVLANYLSFNINYTAPAWAAGGGVAGASVGAATAGSATTCYDNGGIASNPMQYSVKISNGANVNCSLSFKFQ